MISVKEALDHVLGCAKSLPEKRLPLGSALGLRLAEAIVSDVDSPPFDKAMLDGYALSVDDPSPTLRVTEQVLAGGVPHHAVEPGTTIRVMTGAPVPDGADVVIKHEDVQHVASGTSPNAHEGSTIKFPVTGVVEGGGIMGRGTAFHRGQEVLSAGKPLTPVELALLAELGRANVVVTPRPLVAVLATGNELVEAGQPVGPAQICNSNSPMLLALLDSQCAAAADLGIARDDSEELLRLIAEGLTADVLLISGGVSAGLMDLVPDALAQLGVEKVFHKVRIKPGKPLWFGKKEEESGSTLVFGMPGNPVSTLVSFELFVKPALMALSGGDVAATAPLRGVLTDSTQHRGQRTTYNPCRANFGDCEAGELRVELLPWRGSADLAAMTHATALAVLPPGDYELAAGAEVEVLKLSC